MTQPASRNALAAALLAVLNANLDAMSTPRRAYEWDKAPTKGGDYVLVTLSRVYGGNRHAAGHLSPSMWRMTTRAVGSVTNASILLDRCTAALEQVSITVGSESSTGIQFESETDVQQDDDDQSLWSGLRSWTFAF